MVHRPQGQVLDPQIPEGLPKLSQRETSVNLLDNLAIDGGGVLHLLLYLGIVIIFISSIRIKLFFELNGG